MKNFKLPIYHCLYSLVKQLYGVIGNMPRAYKYEIGRDIQRLAWQCLDLALAAAKERGADKAGIISELSSAFDRLKLRLRLASEVGAISTGCFAHLQENYLAEAGRMLGGWRKWAGKAGAKERE